MLFNNQSTLVNNHCISTTLSRCSEDRLESPGYFDKMSAGRESLLIFVAKRLLSVCTLRPDRLTPTASFVSPSISPTEPPRRQRTGGGELANRTEHSRVGRGVRVCHRLVLVGVLMYPVLYPSNFY
jgi:hypothetical protein